MPTINALKTLDSENNRFFRTLAGDNPECRELLLTTREVVQRLFDRLRTPPDQQGTVMDLANDPERQTTPLPRAA